MQAIYPYKLLSQQDIDACRMLAEAALLEWEAGWHPNSAVKVECAATDKAEPLDEPWTAYDDSAQAAIWVRCQDGFEKRLEQLLFDLDQAVRSGERRDSDLAAVVAAQARADLVAIMLKHLPTAKSSGGSSTARSFPAWLLRRHAGSALIRFSCNGKALDLLVPHAHMPPRVKKNNVKLIPGSQLATLPAALTDCKARLIAQLGEVEISLGELTTLAIGDVVRLPVSLDQPLRLLTETGRQVSLAHLGQQHGHRAVEILAPPKK